MLVAKDHQKILLKLREPEQVMAIIPGAKTVNIKGQDIVSVPHTLDVARLLRNLNITAPSPVLYYYDWPGRFQPFVHQRETVEFLTLNPRAFCLNDMGCVDASTEYLSPTGWVRMDQYAGGEVAQYVPERGVIEFVAPQEFVKLPCPEMIRFKTKYGVDQLLSPEHRVLLTDATGRREVTSAQEVQHRHDAWLRGEHLPKRIGRIGFTKAAIPVTFSTTGGPGIALSDAELRVQIAVIADGHFASNTNRVVMRLKRARKIARLRQLLNDAAIPFKERAQDTATAKGYTLFTFASPTRDKQFCAAWWAATDAQLDVIADEVLHWDGSISTDRPTARFSTFVEASADYVQYVFASRGRVARIITNERPGKKEYVVQIRANGDPLQLVSTGTDGTHNPTVWTEPSTDGFKYCFKVPSTFLLFRRNGCIFASGNTGKTLSVLWAFDYLRKLGQVDYMIVVSPLSTLERTWADEIFMNFPDMSYAVVHGAPERRAKLLKAPYDVYIINHDGIKSKQTLAQLKSIPGKPLIVIDELASFRNASTERWKAANRLVNGDRKAGEKPVEWAWGLTGTPIPNEPTDAWAQVRLIAPANVPPYFGAFRDMVMKPITKFKWSPRFDALTTVHRVMQPGIRFDRDECIDLPPTTFINRTVELTPEQKALYKDMLSKLRAQYLGGQITALNEAVLCSKLLQICVGVAYTDTGDLAVPSKPRTDAVLEIIEEATAKVIVFVPLTGGLDKVAEAIGEHYSVAVVDGRVSKAKRDAIFHDFKQANGPRVLVAQPGTMSHGLTLVAANTIVWYAPINSAEIYAQANARIVRPGQSRNTLIVRVEGSELERKMYKRLENKETTQGVLLDLFD